MGDEPKNPIMRVNPWGDWGSMLGLVAYLAALIFICGFVVLALTLPDLRSETSEQTCIEQVRARTELHTARHTLTAEKAAALTRRLDRC